VTAKEMSGYPTDVLSRLFTEHTLKHIYNHQHHVKIGEELDLKGCLPSTFMTLAPGSHSEDVWHDVCRMRTLNGEQSIHGLNNHICPLQFDIVDRIINRYTNTGETVFDPFGGLMTVPYRAIMQGRKGVAVELNRQYFIDGLHYLKAAESQALAPTLFDFENIKKD
jgi:DNA modification methylase